MIRVTATKVQFAGIPRMFENDWELLVWNETLQTAVMWKRTESELVNDLPIDLDPKRGEGAKPVEPGAPQVEEPSLPEPAWWAI